MKRSKRGTIEPTDAESVMGRTTEEAISSFVQLTQEDMQNEANQPDDLLKTLREGEQRLVPFKRNDIRSIFHENAWWFSIIDVIKAIAETDRARTYWTDLKRKLKSEGFAELHDKIVRLKLQSIKDGKIYRTDCVDTETLFRLIQSIPSPKAEPFRRWLAKVGYERILETQDPEIAIKRALYTYKAKGYSDEWVNTRIQTIASRKDVTNEWKNRGIEEGLEYALLTDAIAKETFNMRTKEHKSLKRLSKHHNLRNHMSPMELALVMLGETTTAELARSQDAQGFQENGGSELLHVGGGDPFFSIGIRVGFP
ncbi:Bro-N domain-containing protein [candidate division TA06 bacterium]|nr:Bro-N domain-containing protein [candidate division TA06 bacterium]